MDSPAKLRIGDWRVDPTAGQIVRGGEAVRVEARTLRLLLDLAEHAGQVVSIDDLLDRVWAGVTVTPDSVYQAVALLRRQLGDDPRRPRYIATVPRLGYRLVAEVAPWREDEDPVASRTRRASGVAMFAALGLTAAAAGAVWFGLGQRAATVPPGPVSVGVMPFLDLSAKMDRFVLADDLTEGVVDRLSQNRSLRTPSFRASFLLQGKHLPPIEAASRLHVTYVVDGALHTHGGGVRVTARLSRGDNGYVVWSQTYDRPGGDVSTVPATIAAEVAKALAVGPAPG
jgi:transcriptional activator of cad operon